MAPAGPWWILVLDLYDFSVAEVPLPVGDHLPTWLKNIGEGILSRTASALETAGRLIASALSALYGALMTFVDDTLNTVLAPFYNARDSNGAALNAAVDPSGSEAIWEAIGGTIFGLGLAIAITISVVMNIVRDVGFGAGFVVSILIGLVLALGLTALQYLLPGITSPSPQMVTTLQTFSNGYWPQGPQGPNWTSMSTAFSYWENGASDTYAFMGLQQAWSDTIHVSQWQFAAQAYSFAFALVSSAMAFFAATLSGGSAVLASDIAIVLAGVSVVLEIPALASWSRAGTSVQDHTTDLIIFGLDTSDVGLSIAELAKGE